MINQAINNLIKYGLSKNLLTTDDQTYVLNKLGDLLNIHEVSVEKDQEMSIDDILNHLLKYAIENNIVIDNNFEARTAFEGRLMDCLMPRPSELNKMFRSKYKKSPQQATKFFHDFSQDCLYIKSNPLKNNLNFLYKSQYGDLDLHVNCLKFDAFIDQQRYFNFNHRQVSISVNNEKNAWTMQYLPYPILEEQCLISRKDHLEPYNNDRTFEELIDFINKFPQYFIMSDVSKSMSNDGILPYHYLQGGKHVFPIESAQVAGKYKNGRVRVEVLDWPVSAIRLIGNNENKLLDVMHDLYQNWSTYSDDNLKIQAKTDNETHNFIDVFIKLDGSKFNVYMVFKNTRKTKEYPQGIFQPKQTSVFKNFGILEDLGLFEISKSIYDDLERVKNILMDKTDISKYSGLIYLKTWFDMIKDKEQPKDLDLFLTKQVGELFENNMKETNVFKFGSKEDFIAFVEKAV